MYCQIPPTYLHMTLENSYTKEEFADVVLLLLAISNQCSCHLRLAICETEIRPTGWVHYVVHPGVGVDGA